ncbi:hypothetical protein [Formosa haliotis]|uniref:hypothetical protein n=1 Tax=Formosa haliotis TaxID=1555194 RepID=UPI000825CD9F|nr:hypothetical protein [Formosa haliotis]
MKKILIFILVGFSFNLSFAQDWMTNLEVAERLALAQNKLIVAVWQNSYFNGIPAFVDNNKGEQVFVENIIDEPVVDSLLWAHFIPVMLLEDDYEKLYKRIENRSNDYKTKFSDDSFKVMDANGNILNVTANNYMLNLTNFLHKYSMDMSFLETKMINYKKEKNFYSAFYVGAQYLDFAFFAKQEVRPELADLAGIYLDEAAGYINTEPEESRAAITQRVHLLNIQKYLILERPNKVLRQLKRIKEDEVAAVNKNLRSFLYYSAYTMLHDTENVAVWQPNVTALDRRKLMSLMSNIPH